MWLLLCQETHAEASEGNGEGGHHLRREEGIQKGSLAEGKATGLIAGATLCVNTGSHQKENKLKQ